jgi:chitin synthase
LEKAPKRSKKQQIPDLGDAHGRYSGYDDGHNDYDLDPDYHQQPYDPEPFQAEPQDIPLLHRNSGYDQFYDPHQGRPDLQHQSSRQSFHPDLQHQQSFHADVDLEGGSDIPARPPAADPTLLGNFGHLIYDCPVPPKLLRNIPHTQPPGRDEFTHMRYTAATCDPEDFTAENFTLRPQLFTKRRQTELFIVVTMYNEDDVLFARTMAGVFANIQYMCTLKGKHNGLWDKDGWKKIVVCIVVDGRTKLDKRTQAVMTALGVYQHGVGVQEVNEKPVTAHIYEYTTKVSIELRKGIVETKPGALDVPVQIIFCLKEKNQKKINSHRWALQAFGGALQPNIVVLLDAGTRPGNKSIYELWKAFDLDPNCGGACGEIKAMLGKGKGWEKLLNPIIAAQNFEYKMSNILDKPMESAFGFISVLPGAFSAYRFIALQNDKRGKGPLEKYFDGEKHHLDADIFTKNMYLAEDRILCFELVAKRKSHWVLTYVCSATGETDVPEEMPELIKQRRRWLNGSFFAAVYALVHFYQIFRSSHSMLRKIMFMIEFLYQTVSMIFSWFAVGNFFLVFQILTTALGGPSLLGHAGEILSVVIEWIYLGSLVTCFVLSLGNTPDGSRRFYMVMVYTWAVIMV